MTTWGSGPAGWPGSHQSRGFPRESQTLAAAVRLNLSETITSISLNTCYCKSSTSQKQRSIKYRLREYVVRQLKERASKKKQEESD